MERPILAALLSCQGTTLSDDEQRLFAQANPLGITLFGRNISNPTQLKNLIDQIKNCINREDVLIAVDQEGGRVQRLHQPDYPDFAAQITLGRISASRGLKTALKAAATQAQLISHDLHSAGINLNFAPCLDLAYPETSPVLYSRTFGSDPILVADLGRKMAQTYIRRGICPCIKHFTGMGRATADPHLHLPVIDAALEELEKDFYPFQKLYQAPAGMTAHVMLPEIDPQNPVTQSKAAINRIIRGLIGFEGLLISDAIDMHSLRGTLGERAAASLEAGCDAVCYCLGNYNEMLEVVEKSSNLRDKSLIRFEKIKKILHNKYTALDYSVKLREYRRLIGSVAAYSEEYDATETLQRMQNQQGEK